MNWASHFVSYQSLELEGNHLLVGESEGEDRGQKGCSIYGFILGKWYYSAFN